jgi:Ca2+-binding EF-hand superfamily protein
MLGQEFDTMLRVQLHMGDVSSEQIKAWFSACDRDRNGVVDEHEFFLFSIQSASRQAGFDVGGLADALVRTYDKSGDGIWNGALEAVKACPRSNPHYLVPPAGEMDRKEFTAMATTLGFGEIANTLFDSFDADGSAVISIGEICAHVHRMMYTPLAADHVSYGRSRGCSHYTTPQHTLSAPLLHSDVPLSRCRPRISSQADTDKERCKSGAIGARFCDGDGSQRRKRAPSGATQRRGVATGEPSVQGRTLEYPRAHRQTLVPRPTVPRAAHFVRASLSPTVLLAPSLTVVPPPPPPPRRRFQGAPLVKRTTIWRLEEALKQKQFYTVGDAEEELEAFRKELSDALIKQGKSVSILFAAMDRDGDHPYVVDWNHRTLNDLGSPHLPCGGAVAFTNPVLLQM